MKKTLLILSLIIITFSFSVKAQLLAFPGAEGFGKYAKGVRGSTTPTVYHVTNLNDSGTGSLRDAISQPNRIVVFDVSGIIKITERLIFSSNLTIAGQTAPGDGVVIYGNGVSFSGTKDVIVRYMRFRMGLNGDDGKDAAGVANGSDMIFDHCSFTWGRDETFSISWDNKGTEPGNITIQNSIIGQGILVHSAGGLIQTNGGVTLYKNLYTDNKTRNPKVKGLNQYVNNVCYNWGSGGGYILGDTEGDSWAAIENNYFIKGPTTGGTDAFVRANQYFQVCQSGNYLDYTTDGVLNGVLADTADFGPATFVSNYAGFINTPKAHPVITNKLSAADAYYWIVDSVGPVLPFRDQVDKYIINELSSLGVIGTQINGEADLGLINSVGDVFSANKQLDTDNDGIPDSWEDANGLNKTNNSDAITVATNGYLNIENYINGIKAGTPFLKYPTLLAIKSIDSDYIFLKWKNNEPNAKNTILEISTDNNSFTTLATLNPSITEYKAENLSPNTSYFFRLKTSSDALESKYSDVIKATTFGVASPPVACTNPIPANKSTIVEYMGTTLSWTNTTGFWGGDLFYTVYFGTDSANLQKVATDILTTTYTATLQPNTQYFWRVDTKNAMGEIQGNIWSFTSAKKTEKEKVAYFKFDETTGNNALNELEGNAVAVNITPVWESGISGNSILFSGTPTTQRLVQPFYSLLNIGNQSFTFDLWFKSPGGTSTDWYLFHKGTHVANTTTGATGKWFGLQYKNNLMTFAIDDNVTKTNIDVTANQYFNNEWTYVAGVRDMSADKISIYINGVLKGQTTDKTGDINETGDLIIGNRNVNFDNPFKGNIDEFSIYKDILTPEEILDNYNKKILSSVGNTKSHNHLKVYPTFFTDYINIESNILSVGKNISIQLYSTVGQMVYRKDINSIPSSLVKIDNLNNLPAGTYICVLKSTEKTATAVLMKK